MDSSVFPRIIAATILLALVLTDTMSGRASGKKSFPWVVPVPVIECAFLSPIVDESLAQSECGKQMGAEIVAFAKEQLGKRYVYGAKGPNTFDCSGLTWYVYKHFNVTLSRTSSAQANQNIGLKITDRENLMPGDLIYFPGKSGRVGHAGLYIGDGLFVEAPYSGARVRISRLTAKRRWSWGRRIFL